jgi:hypothetical protein
VSLAVRGLLVLLIGLALDRLPAGVYVVLPYLGATLICAAALLRLRTTWLIALAVTFWVAGSHLSFLARPRGDMAVSSAHLDLTSVSGFLSEILLTGAYPVVTWLVYVLAGIVLARALRIAMDRDRRTHFALAVVASGAFLLAVAITVSTLYTRVFVAPWLARELGITVTEAIRAAATPPGAGQPWGDGWDLVLTAAPHTGTTFDIARTLGFACVVIGLLVLTGQRIGPRVRAALRPLRFGGAAPLSAYSLHVVALGIAGIALTRFAEDSPGPVNIDELPWYSGGSGMLALHVCGFLLVACILTALRRRGPAETVVSRLSRVAAELPLRRRPPQSNA